METIQLQLSALNKDFKLLYVKYKNKYLNLKNKLFKQKYVYLGEQPSQQSFESFCDEIYSNAEIPVNQLLINLQRHDEIGYLAPECVRKDSQPNIYPSPFASGLDFETYKLSEPQDRKEIEYLIMLKNVFSEIINDFNNNDTIVEYAKKNIGLTILLSNCVVRIFPIRIFNKLRTLYDHLTLDRTGENEKWDNFERIYRIYISEKYSVVFIVSS